MRTLLTILFLSLLGSAAGAREYDAGESYGDLPQHTTSESMRAARRMKKEPASPAKYDTAFPVRDHAPMMLRERGAI